MVAENVIGNRPDAVLFQMSAPVQKKKRKKKKEETPHEHLQTEKQENKRSEKERVRNSGTYYNTKKIKKKP